MTTFKEMGMVVPDINDEKYNTLSIREKEIFILVASGYNSKVIAIGLNISQDTVKHHRRIVLKKIEVGSF